MYILGIETSCDETAAAIVSDGRYIHSNIVLSSLKEHSKYGGVIPEIASRRQLECIHAVVTQALSKTSIPLSKIQAIAVTQAPGLIGSLLVGTSFAQALSQALQKPLIHVNHIHAHLYANFLTPAKGKNASLPELPAVGLVVSGGHTSLYKVTKNLTFTLLGKTRDDAAGESFDKVSKILDLGYPGGPVIDRLAKSGKKTDIHFTCARLPDTLDFSFSGIKTAVRYYHEEHHSKPSYKKEDIAYAFQDSVVGVLVDKSLTACLKEKTRSLLIGGGVAANSALREKLIHLAHTHHITVHFPPMPLCLDNAAMIAGLSYHLHKKHNRLSKSRS